ncbi:MAG TPA: DUF615 domain-containing protein [Gammaproteobacteria bacterium]|nr:DUF615 domain-containing protein [Gammaproteobacteria bacterium]
MTEADNNNTRTETSKSQKKRDALALQELGERLTELPEDALRKLPLPDPLLDAILAAKKIQRHGGRKRQMQYIGKIMRSIDPEPVEQALKNGALKRKRDTSHFHQIEQWRDALIENPATTLDELISKYPDLDIQHVRQLVRNAQFEANKQKPARSSRALFQYLRELAQH